MTENLKPIIDAILEAEGWPEFTDDPDDPGGPTKGGITIKTLRSWRREQGSKAPITPADVEALDEDEVRAIYVHRYIIKPGFGGIGDRDLAAYVIDCGVLHDTRKATRWLQEAVGKLRVDGKLGPLTAARVNIHPQSGHIMLKMVATRMRFMGRRIEHRRSQAKWAAGWLDRCADGIDTFVVPW